MLDSRGVQVLTGTMSEKISFSAYIVQKKYSHRSVRRRQSHHFNPGYATDCMVSFKNKGKAKYETFRQQTMNVKKNINDDNNRRTGF